MCNIASRETLVDQFMKTLPEKSFEGHLVDLGIQKIE